MFENFDSLLQDSSAPIAAFLGGFAATLTPCVYPLIPITLSIVGAGKEVSRSRALWRASLYSLGIVASYSILGVVAVQTGSFFGSVWSSPAFRFVLGAIIFCYGLVSLELINVRSTGALGQKVAGLGGDTWRGAFLAGAVSGILASPCTAPLLATILTFAASSSNSLLGIALLFFYAIGFSLPFFMLALFPQAFSWIPRSGGWLHGIKFVIGAALLTLGAYYLSDFQVSFLKPLFGLPLLIFYPATGLLLLLLCRMGTRSYLNESRKQRLLASVTFALVALPSLLLGRGHSLNADPSSNVLAEAFERAKEKNAAVVLEFTADWCVQCRELAKAVFANPLVHEEMKSAEMTVVDLSNASSDEKKLQKDLGVRGLPAILFLCPSGKEFVEKRVNQVISAEEFLVRLRDVQSQLSSCG